MNAPRAEEVIAETYRQILQLRKTGETPARVVMPPELWRLIEDYRRGLGILEGPHPDYLSENSLFGLEIWYGESSEIRVESEERHG